MRSFWRVTRLRGHRENNRTLQEIPSRLPKLVVCTHLGQKHKATTSISLDFARPQAINPARRPPSSSGPKRGFAAKWRDWANSDQRIPAKQQIQKDRLTAVLPKSKLVFWSGGSLSVPLPASRD
jgi:hypothetical protein